MALEVQSVSERNPDIEIEEIIRETQSKKVLGINYVGSFRAAR
jgi:hypothetical protein